MAEAEMSSLGQSRRPQRRWIFIGVGIVLASCLLCLCAGNFASSLGRGQVEVEAVVNQFMEAMEDGNVATAQALFGERLDAELIQGQLTEMDPAYFEGYRSLAVNQFRLGPQLNADPMAPRGIVARMTGTIRYTGSKTGTFEAILEQDGNTWCIYGIHINISEK